jgi:hypothetical protein
MFISDPRLKALVSRFGFQESNRGLGAIEPIPEGILNAALVTGRSRTLWLSGTHRRTSVKADNKILSGIDLRDAIDPLGDQTYHFTSARSMPTLGDRATVLGVTPRRSRIWIGPSEDWRDVRETISLVLSHVSRVSTPILDPLPVLALSSLEASAISQPFDLAIVPPELAFDDPGVDQDTIELMDRWGYRATFTVTPTDGSRFIVEPYLEGERIGTLEFALDVSNPSRVSWTVENPSPAQGKGDLLREVEAVCRKRDWLKIWFESGHTLSGGALYEVRHRDIPFTGYAWAQFGGYEVTVEKPDDLLNTGNSNSLFDWVQNYWPNLDGSLSEPGGWLACDDGSMEIADFIYINENAAPPILCLIHAKSSGSDSPTRGISVAEYQVVTAQAVKNLRYLDREIIAEGLQQGLGKRVSNLVWRDRSRSDRSSMVQALGQLGANFVRQVVIVQPRHTRTADGLARASPSSSDMARLRQLDTLLISADNDCHGLGATLTVVCEDV